MVGVADKFPASLPEFRRMFPDDGACARYLESVRWREGFVCPRCGCASTTIENYEFRFNRRFYPHNSFRSLL